MKTDIEKLTLTDNELQGFIGVQDLKRATEINTKNDIPKQSERIIRPSVIIKCNNIKESSLKKIKEHEDGWYNNYSTILAFIYIGIIAIIAVILPTNISANAVVWIVFALLPIVILISISIDLIKKKEEKIYDSIPKQPTRLGTLLDEVDKYNEVVRHFLTIEQLHEIGQSIGIDDREHVLEVLGSMRKDLVRALQTDKILRDNPNFRIEKVLSETIPLVETLKFSADAQETERLVKEALDIGLRVQEEMKKLW